MAAGIARGGRKERAGRKGRIQGRAQCSGRLWLHYQHIARQATTAKSFWLQVAQDLMFDSRVVGAGPEVDDAGPEGELLKVGAMLVDIGRSFP